MPKILIMYNSSGKLLKKYTSPNVHRIAYMNIPTPCPIDVTVADKNPLELAINNITNRLGPGKAAPMKHVIAIEIQS